MVSKALNIIVSSPGQENIKFKLYPDTVLEKLMDKYAETIINKDPSQLDFVYEGIKVNKDSTPRSLGMIDGDIIKVNEIPIGG